MDTEEIEQILWKSGLKNAVKFEGVPNKKAIMGKLMAKRKDLRSRAKEIIPMLDDIIKEISAFNIEEQKEKLLAIDPDALKEESKEEEKELPELPNVQKYDKVIMRLAPYPSGALHIGNARMIVLNDQYVKKYGGELYLFYDDTIGSPKSLRNSPKAKYVLPEAYELIDEGLKWLNVDYSKVFYKSDRMNFYYEYCEKLIKQELAYVCFCSAEDFRVKYKDKKLECPHRSNTVEQNLAEWEKMLDKKYGETEAVVRLKTGMNQKDPALRDQIIMRISEAEHPRVGTKYWVWPMLEFSWAIDDHLIGVTHILRGADLIKEDFIEEFIWERLNWKKAEFLHYGRINFPDMKLSKTKARNKIEKRKYTGWEDPRTWSLQSLKKRGIRPEALREALLDLGMSMSGITFSVNWLYAKNQDLIDEESDRYFFVEDPILVEINKVPFEEYLAEPSLLPTKPEKGKRKIHGKVKKKNKMCVYIALSDAQKSKKGEIIRLKDLINIKITSKDLKNKNVYASYHSLELNRDFSIIQWVPEEANVAVSILKPDGKISKGLGETNLTKIPMNSTIQFERYGFVNPIKFEDKELFCYFTH
ncbi:MAG: glutamate--tRNA ligase [Candidatus Lokiarchaeota archaeon]|nr:glutamate--tRNA ligase [Candidatus Lokiarchaeota archaeon]MBD3340974.1 glutamate--tRNA ligase [Candidatus Lokiarchaeota archaeon]